MSSVNPFKRPTKIHRCEITKVCWSTQWVQNAKNPWQFHCFISGSVSVSIFVACFVEFFLIIIIILGYQVMMIYFVDFNSETWTYLTPCLFPLLLLFGAKIPWCIPGSFYFYAGASQKKTPQPRTITCGELMGTHSNHHLPITIWWFQPIWKILVRLDYFPK